MEQSLADAATVDFAWSGEALSPLSPVNLRGIRDSAGSLLIEWTRRGRLAPGLTPGSDVPLAEETERYDVEILTTGNVLKRTIPVGSVVSNAAVLLGVIQPQCVDRNNLVAPAPPNIEALAYTRQEFIGAGGWLEATLTAPANSFAALGLTEAHRKGLNRAATTTFDVEVLFSQVSAVFPGLTVREGGVVKYSSGLLGTVTSLRIRILISGTEIRYYWDYTGPGSVPFYISRIVPVFPLAGFVQLIDDAGGLVKVGNTVVGSTYNPSTIYSLDQQTEDFGSAQNPIRVRVSQISAIVGRGPYVQADL